MTSYEDLAKMATVQISPQVQTAIRVRFFALALWQEAVRAVQGCACASADLRLEPSHLDGFSLRYQNREVQVLREQDHVRVLTTKGASYLSFLLKGRHDPPTAPEDVQKEVEALLHSVLTFLFSPF